MVKDVTKEYRAKLAPNRQRARTMRAEPVQAEKIFWSFARNRQLNGYKFKRQVPVGPYIADFVCLERKLIIELDGPFHARRAGYDAKRDSFLERQGFSVLRISNEELAGDASGVVAMILNELKLLPLPHRGKGPR
jgi:very-short-patch-repair endonuclease